MSRVFSFISNHHSVVSVLDCLQVTYEAIRLNQTAVWTSKRNSMLTQWRDFQVSSSNV